MDAVKFSKEERRMFRSFGAKHNEPLKNPICIGFLCENCEKEFGSEYCSFSIEERVEKVEKWSKEHPVITNAMKYKEVFGLSADTCCPLPMKASSCEGSCTECKKWWDEEYKEPESEEK